VNYGDLTPQHVLDALDAVGQRGDGRILQLNSYENRVFQVMLEDTDGPAGAAVVAKFYRPGRWNNAQILEEHQFALELAAAEVPVVPPLVLSSPSANASLILQGDPPTLACDAAPTLPHRFAVAARCAGRAPELDDPGVLRQIGRFIGRLHSVGRRQPFVHRHVLNAAVDGQRARNLLLDGGFVTAVEKPAWLSACDQALAATVDAFNSLAPLATLRLHGDCHPGNVLWRQDGTLAGPHVVDLDDAMQGPAVQDLWMLVSGDRASMATAQ